MDNIHNFEIIHQYSRKQAIQDGILADVSKEAKEAGIKWPVALTVSVWADYVCWTDEDSSRQTYQDASGRLSDLLWMLRLAMQKAQSGLDRVIFSFYCIPRGGRKTRPILVTLKAIVSAGDNFEPVITVMMPSED